MQGEEKVKVSGYRAPSAQMTSITGDIIANYNTGLCKFLCGMSLRYFYQIPAPVTRPCAAKSFLATRARVPSYFQCVTDPTKLVKYFNWLLCFLDGEFPERISGYERHLKSNACAQPGVRICLIFVAMPRKSLMELLRTQVGLLDVFRGHKVGKL